MTTSEERLEQLERSLQQAESALQAANYRIATLETTTSADNTHCDNSTCLDGRHACAWEALKLCCRRSVVEELELRNVVLLCGSLTRAACSDGKGQDDSRRHEEREPHSGEQVWSRQLYYMLSMSTSGEAQRRLQKVPEGEGAERAEDRYEVRQHAQADSLV